MEEPRDAAPEFRYEGRDLEAMAEAAHYREWVLSRLRPYLGDDVAEIGAGNGNFTGYLAREVGRSLTSFEPAAEQFAKIPARVDAPIEFERVHGSLADHAEQLRDRFDTIIYVNVLEHVDDDAAELRHVARALRPGGYLCVFVPALSWLMSDFDRRVGHRRRYDRAMLRALAEGAALEVRELAFMDSLGVLPWFVFMRLLGGDLTARKARLYDRFVVPWLRVIDTRWTPPIGKSLLMVARRPLENAPT